MKQKISHVSWILDNYIISFQLIILGKEISGCCFQENFSKEITLNGGLQNLEEVKQEVGIRVFQAER